MRPAPRSRRARRRPAAEVDAAEGSSRARRPTRRRRSRRTSGTPCAPRCDEHVDVVELRHEPLPRPSRGRRSNARAAAHPCRDALLALEVDPGERDLVAVRVEAVAIASPIPRAAPVTIAVGTYPTSTGSPTTIGPGSTTCTLLSPTEAARVTTSARYWAITPRKQGRDTRPWTVARARAHRSDARTATTAPPTRTARRSSRPPRAPRPSWPTPIVIRSGGRRPGPVASRRHTESIERRGRDEAAPGDARGRRRRLPAPSGRLQIDFSASSEDLTRSGSIRTAVTGRP